MANRDDDSPEAKWKANDDKQRELGGTFDHLLGKSYDDKDAALRKMGDFRGRHGSDGLFHALRNEPHSFGDLPKGPAITPQAFYFVSGGGPSNHRTRNLSSSTPRLQQQSHYCPSMAA